MESSTRVQPTAKEELQEIIKATINEKGLQCDLNFIDTSLFTDMSELFRDTEFDGDISLWDVSNVEHMSSMFACSEFNNDISQCDVSKVEDMEEMFDFTPLEELEKEPEWYIKWCEKRYKK